MNKRTARHLLFSIYVILNLCLFIIPLILLKVSPSLFNAIDNTKIFFIKYFISFLCLLFSFAISYKIIKKVDYENDIINRYNNNIVQYQQEYEKFLLLKENYIQIHKIKHDINNILNQAQILSNNSDTVSQNTSKEIINNLQNKLQELNIYEE